MNDFTVKFPPEVLAFYQEKKPMIGAAAIAERARLRAELDFMEIQPWLPDSIKSYVNIGCGQGVLDVFMARTYAPESVLLIDGGSAEKETGFKETIVPWTDLTHTQAILRANVSGTSFTFATPNEPFDYEAELVLSLRSWAHHYPVRTYLESVKKALSNGGVLIVDVRKETNGRRKLSEVFCYVGTIGGSPKRDRMVFTA